MKRSEMREVLFKLLFRAEFNDVTEMPEQMQLYFSTDADNSKIKDEDREYIIKREEDILSKLPEIEYPTSCNSCIIKLLFESLTENEGHK